MGAPQQIMVALKPASGGAPTLASASVNSAGTQLTLNWSASCTNGAGGSGGVTISATGGASTPTYSSGSPGSAFVYTLSRTITAGETVTVSYTQPGNGIEATTGGADVASFSSQPVTNNVPNNNVAIVSQNGNNMNNSSNACVIAGLSTLTAGNSILVSAIAVNVSGALSFSAAGVTQIAGTATLGTPVMVRHTDGVSGGDITSAHFRIPITGSGTIDLQIAASATCYMIVGAAEVSGLHATPDDGNNIVTGTGTSHTTNSITTTAQGIIMYAASEQVANDFTRTWSNTSIFHVDTASTDFTAIVQFKITTTTSNTLTDATGTESGPWQVTWAAYKTS